VNKTFTHALFQSLKESPSPLRRPTTPTAVLREIVVLSPSCEYQRHPKIENTQKQTKQPSKTMNHSIAKHHRSICTVTPASHAPLACNSTRVFLHHRRQTLLPLPLPHNHTALVSHTTHCNHRIRKKISHTLHLLRLKRLMQRRCPTQQLEQASNGRKQCHLPPAGGNVVSGNHLRASAELLKANCSSMMHHLTTTTRTPAFQAPLA
jgi:hypothetical protein